MAENYIFDFGNVITRFYPDELTLPYIEDEVTRKSISDIVFDRLYWDRLDAGTITDEEVVAACRTRLPERLWDVAERIYYDWIYNIPEIEGMRELICRIRDTYSVRLFLLSNISTYFATHAEEIPVLALFEKCIFSSVCGKVKPHREIFEYLCAECGILPEETLFVDDNAANIAGARDFGITGYLFDGDVNGLKSYLQHVLQKR